MIPPKIAARNLAEILAASRLLLVAAVLALAVAIPAPAHAAGLRIPASGVLRTQSGGPVADGGDYILFVKLYAAADAKTALWKDTFKQVSVQRGFFGIVLGTGEEKLPDALFAAGAARWIGIAVGGDAELPRVRLHTVPFAVHARVAASLDCIGCVKSVQAGFTYAASDTKGGSALKAAQAESAVTATTAGFAERAGRAANADHALTAESAKTADSAAHALTAGSAKTAQNATYATSAKSALALQCTGCVPLGALATSARQAFVSVQGGKISGSLEVADRATVGHKLVLGNALIDGGRFAAGDRGKIPCDPDHLGRVLLDPTTRRLYMCDGSEFKRLRMCSEKCSAPAKIDCGQKVTNGCGDTTGCSGAGTFCAGGAKCENGTCGHAGDTRVNPAASCRAIRKINAAAKSGIFWLNSGGAPAFRAYCDMDTDGGGWTMVLRVSNFDGGIDFRPNGSGWHRTSYKNIDQVSLTNARAGVDYVSVAYGHLGASDVMVRERLGSDYLHSVRTRDGFLGGVNLRSVLVQSMIDGGRRCSKGIVYMGGSPRQAGYDELVLAGDESGDTEPARIGIRQGCAGDSETLQVGYTRNGHGTHEVFTQGNHWAGLASVYVFVR